MYFYWCKVQMYLRTSIKYEVIYHLSNNLDCLLSCDKQHWNAYVSFKIIILLPLKNTQ